MTKSKKAIIGIFIAGFVFCCFILLFNKPNPAYATETFNNISLAQDKYSEEGPKGPNYDEGIKAGDHWTNDRHIHFHWVSYVWFGAGHNGDNWARERISNINGYLTGSTDDCTFNFMVYKTDKTNDVANDSNWGKGMVVLRLYRNGSYVSSYGEKGNCDMSDAANKSYSWNIGALSDDVEYRINVTIQFKYQHNSEYALYEGSWDYYFKPQQIWAHNQNFLSGYVYQNGIYYYNKNFAFVWNNDYTANRNGNRIRYQLDAYAKKNNVEYPSGKVVSDEGRHDFLFYNKRETLHNYTAILDRTAPQPAFSTAGTNNIYAKGTTVNYSYNAQTEAPITVAKYSRRAITVNENVFTIGAVVEQDVNFSSGKAFNDSGIYTVTLTDLCGNTSTTEFCVINREPNYNYRMARTRGYFKTDNYSVSIKYLQPITIPDVLVDGQAAQYPGEWKNGNRYIFSTEANAIRFMSELDMVYRNVRTNVNGEYLYRPTGNPESGTTVPYKTAAELWSALNTCVVKLNGYSLTKYGDATTNSSIYADGSISILDGDAVSVETKQGEFFIGRSFEFKNFTRTAQNGNVLYTYNTLTNLKIEQNGQVVYNRGIISGKTLSYYVGSNAGLFRFTETDSAGNTKTYEAYYDDVAPYITADYEYYELYSNDAGERESRVIANTTTLRNGNEISDTNLKSLSIAEIIDDYDAYVFACVEKPDGNVIVTREFDTLKFGKEGPYEQGGVYRVKVYDRSLNVFEYVFSIAGKTPKVTSYTQGSGENKKLYISFANGSADSSITHFTIYRYGMALPDGVYQEYVDDVLVNSVTISQDIWSYAFYKGGIYTVRFTDNFNRVTVSEEIVFMKGLPSYTITGVADKGKTNKAVSIIFDNTVGYKMTLDGVEASEYGTTTSEGGRIEIPATAANNGLYFVRLYKKSDEMTYVTVSFTVDTIPPIIRAQTESGAGIEWQTCVNTPFRMDWDVSENVERVRYTIDNGYSRTYTKGSILTDDGVYLFTVTDDVGNTSSYMLELDSRVRYSVTYSGAKYTADDGIFVKNGFTVTADENLALTVKRDGVEIQGRFNTMYVTEGVYELILTDYIGNVETVRITVDQTPPSITVVAIGDEYEPVDVRLTPSDVGKLLVRYNSKLIARELEAEMRFTEWGEYAVTVEDALGNSATETFEIKKRPPVITVYLSDGTALNNGDTVNSSVYFVWNDEQATGKLAVNNGVARSYTQNTIQADEGIYTLTVTDEAKNKASVTVTIVKAVKFSLVTASGRILETIMVNAAEKTNEPFTVAYDGELFVEVTKDGVNLPFTAGQQINVDGVYSFYVYDGLGNSDVRTVTFDSTAPALTYIQGSEPTSAVTVELDTSDVASVTVQQKAAASVTNEYFPESVYTFNAWGTYTITARDGLGNSSTITFTIEKIPPEVYITTVSGRLLNNGAQSTEPFVIVYTEELVVKYVIDNGYSVAYKPDTILNAQGNYRITVTDLANNVYGYEISLDSTIVFGVIIDGTTVREFTDKTVGKRYIELTLGEPLEVTYRVNGGDDMTMTDTVARFTDEGEYEFILTDGAGNSAVIRFELDRTAPLCGIDTAQVTKSDVVFSVDDLNDVYGYKVQKNGAYVSKYVLGKINVFTDEGEYTLTLQDALGNRRTVEFVIKRSINYKMSVVDGFITSGAVTLQIKETGVSVAVKLNGQKLETENVGAYTFADAGRYEITLTDGLGNVKVLTFALDETKYRKMFEFDIPLDSVVTLKKDGAELDTDKYITGDTLRVWDDGNYFLTIKRDGVISTYNFIIDTVIPTLILNGQEIPNGTEIGKVRGDLTVESSKRRSTITLYYNGVEAEYNEGEKLTAAGHYKVVITDDVGNVVEYEFDRAFTLNAGAITMIVVLVAAVILVAALVIRRRINQRVS